MSKTFVEYAMTCSPTLYAYRAWRLTLALWHSYSLLFRVGGSDVRYVFGKPT
jgi:hypothetical protein